MDTVENMTISPAETDFHIAKSSVELTVPILIQSYTNPSGFDMKDLSLDIPSPDDRNGCWRKKHNFGNSIKSNNTDERLISQYFHQSGPQSSDEKIADI